MRKHISDWQEVVYHNNVKHGFHEVGVFDIHQKLLLVVGEITEAQEELRAGHSPTEIYYSLEGTKPEGFGVELADAVIRILDIAEAEGINLEMLIDMKHEYNVTRPYKHGRKF